MYPCKTTRPLHLPSSSMRPHSWPRLPSSSMRTRSWPRLPSSNMRPHSWSRIHSMTRSASHERFVLCEIIEYVLMQIEQPAVRVQIKYACYYYLLLYIEVATRAADRRRNLHDNDKAHFAKIKMNYGNPGCTHISTCQPASPRTTHVVVCDYNEFTANRWHSQFLTHWFVFCIWRESTDQAFITCWPHLKL